MGGYWPSSLFAGLWTERKSRSINSQKKSEANIHGFILPAQVANHSVRFGSSCPLAEVAYNKNVFCCFVLSIW